MASAAPTMLRAYLVPRDDRARLQPCETRSMASPRSCFAVTLCALAACGAPLASDAGVDSPVVEHDAATDARAPADAGVDAALPPPVDPEPRGVVEYDDLGGTPSCETPPESCLEDYERFVWLASAHARPVAFDDVLSRLREIDEGRVPQEPRLGEDVLRQRIVDELGIDFLLEGLTSRTLEVRRLSRAERDGFVEHELELRDPWVGTFGALLLEPTSPGPHPAIVAVHGHGDTMQVYRDDYHGSEHAPRGYVTLILSMRAMGSGAAALLEHDAARTLMESGFSLMGLRVYETLVGIRYARQLASVDPSRVALIGHSGGSSTGNLVVHLEPTLSAFVADHQVDFAEWTARVEIVHCETVPGLYPVSAQIHDRSVSPVPTLEVPYRYTNGMQEIFDFFDLHRAS
jgi:dienelactone hydrolase